MIRVLIIGTGSIGQRHIKALLQNNVNEIAAFKTNKGYHKKLPDDLQNKVIVFYDFNEAIAWQPTHVVISNPTALHYDYIKLLLPTSPIIFVEKPVVHDYTLVEKNRVLKTAKGAVGYNLRFHGLFQKIKEIIDSNEFGKPLKAELNVGHYLPFWHPYEDYKTSYAARKELGGGSLRTLSHEIDLSQFIFGPIRKVFAKVYKLSSLKIDVDDTCVLLFETEKCKLIHVNCDFLYPEPRRSGTIYFANGILYYDYFKGFIKLHIYGNKNPELIYSFNEEQDNQYIHQMKSFITSDFTYLCTFQEGLRVDKIIHLAEVSHKTGSEQCLN